MIETTLTYQGTPCTFRGPEREGEDLGYAVCREVFGYTSGSRDTFVEIERTGLPDPIRVAVRMNELGYHLRLCSPFQPGQPWFAGFTPHGATGWNGRPDIEVGAKWARIAVSLAALEMVRLVAARKAGQQP